MASRIARILILCKTYPSPSGKHVETSCVAGMEENGSLIRLFPVPFRLVDDQKQFKKWQWISEEFPKLLTITALKATRFSSIPLCVTAVRFLPALVGGREETNSRVSRCSRVLRLWMRSECPKA